MKGKISILGPVAASCNYRKKSDGIFSVFQKFSLTESCPMRGCRTDCARPNVELFTFPFTAKNWAWLKRLKNSARNCRFVLCVIWVFFNTAMSQFLMPGPWKKRRLAFPNCPRFSTVYVIPGIFCAESGLATSPDGKYLATGEVTGGSAGLSRSQRWQSHPCLASIFHGDSRPTR
jgi:hypothetical protein